MSDKSYSLILGAFPNKNYAAGWLAGSIPAHLISCELNEKVFWYCPVQFGRGIRETDIEIFKKMIEKALDGKLKIGESYRGLKLNKHGYFYDADLKQISWRFKLEEIFHGDHFSSNAEERERYRRYFSFREIYLEGKIESYEYWFLISDIRKIIKPMGRVEVEKGKYGIPGFKYGEGQLFTYHLRYNAAFVPQIPEACGNTKKVAAEDEIDSYLKQFFLRKLPEKNLRERAIQQAFAVTLMKKHRNWSLTMEDKLKSGRPDVLFKDDDGTLVVVEIKRADNDDPVSQLRKYVDELSVKYDKIRGLVICGKPTAELMEKAKNQTFNVKVIKYSISINF